MKNTIVLPGMSLQPIIDVIESLLDQRTSLRLRAQFIVLREQVEALESERDKFQSRIRLDTQEIEEWIDLMGEAKAELARLRTALSLQPVVLTNLWMAVQFPLMSKPQRIRQFDGLAPWLEWALGKFAAPVTVREEGNRLVMENESLRVVIVGNGPELHGFALPLRDGQVVVSVTGRSLNARDFVGEACWLPVLD